MPKILYDEPAQRLFKLEDLFRDKSKLSLGRLTEENNPDIPLGYSLLNGQVDFSNHVSRKHAFLEYDDTDSYFLIDNSSKNGIKIKRNGKSFSVEGKVRLELRDEIFFGLYGPVFFELENPNNPREDSKTKAE